MEHWEEMDKKDFLLLRIRFVNAKFIVADF